MTQLFQICSYIILSITFLTTNGVAQGTSAAHRHMGHVADGFRGTPDGMGLLPTAIAEAEVAASHASYAANDLTDLAAMQRHAAHVLHALQGGDGGPGLGYGLKNAAEGVVAHIEMAGAGEEASQGITTHSNHVATSSRNTLKRADMIIDHISKIQDADSADEAGKLTAEVAELAEQLFAGSDSNGDGRIGWQENEGGLQQAEQHMNIMKRGEGLP
ncbi:MAG: hypothetical protein CME30_01045 [Gemmatimonadetes bacterium]|nr:hypothetical protein [Gemmatimonadota bacterium]